MGNILLGQEKPKFYVYAVWQEILLDRNLVGLYFDLAAANDIVFNVNNTKDPTRMRGKCAWVEQLEIQGNMPLIWRMQNNG